MIDDSVLRDIIPKLATDTQLEEWKLARDIKSSFLKLGYEDNLSFIPTVIVESWKRSLHNNIDPESDLFGKHININMFNNLLLQHLNIIKTVEKYLLGAGPQRLQKHTRYYLTTINKDGVLIFATGSDETKRYFEDIGLKPGALLSESSIGTTAHSLSMKYGKPAQLIGPYNYLNIFDNCILTAVPIFFNGEIIGAFEVIQYDVPDYAIPFTANVFGMAASMSNVITAQLQIDEERNKLKLVRSFMNVISSPSGGGKGVIVTQRNGEIVYINDTASVWLDYKEADKDISHYIAEFYKVRRLFNSKDKHKDIPITLHNCKDDSVSFTVMVNPLKDTTQNITGNILYITATINQGDKRQPLRYTFDSIIGKHPTIKQVKLVAKNIAPTNNNVLILGESGTGKEIFAQAIHNASDVNGPFVAINCASIPKNLIETELFGYVGGAFTDADKSGKQGKIEFANNGTLFLDEIGDMPLELQPVLLRVLEEKYVVRIGGKDPINVNFRVISATNSDLYQKVLAKQFREDLYFRLAVITLEIPPLRDRGTDILLLAEHFIEKSCRNNLKHNIRLSEEVRDILLNYKWHGNIRQLESAMISAVCSVCNDSEIESVHLPKLIKESYCKENQDSLEYATLDLIRQTLEAYGGNIQETSKKLGISRATIYRKLKKYQTPSLTK